MQGTGFVARRIGWERMSVNPETAQSGSLDAVAIAGAVAADLKGLYGDRLRRVILFGSFARGEGDPGESDIDLMVVLDRVESRFEEVYRMSDVLYRHSLASGVVVSALAVSQDEVAHPTMGVVLHALDEGRHVA